MGFGYRHCLRPLLFKWDAESAHHLGLRGMKVGLGNPLGRMISRVCIGFLILRYSRSYGGFLSPIPSVLAAGLDKNAEVVRPLASFGFSHVEVGTITVSGNRVMTSPACSVCPKIAPSSIAWGSITMAVMWLRNGSRSNWERPSQPKRRPCVLGMNIGKTKLVELEQSLGGLPNERGSIGSIADYLVVNVSSPNTPGLRDLQAEASLRPLLEGVRTALNEINPGCPLVVENSPRFGRGRN